jgi:hypothetical protein
MDAMRVVIDQEVDTMIPLALQHAFPDRRLQDGERVRSGARRQHWLVVGAGKDISVNVRIKSSKMNMMSIINDVRRDGPISRLNPLVQQLLLLIDVLFIRRTRCKAQLAAKTAARERSGVSLTQEGNRIGLVGCFIEEEITLNKLNGHFGKLFHQPEFRTCT